MTVSLHLLCSILPSSRTLFTLLTAFSPYSSARCLAFFTDLPRNFLNWVLIEKPTQWVSLTCFSLESTKDERQATVSAKAHVFCFSFPPSVSARGGWDLSSSSDCAASFLKKDRKNKLPGKTGNWVQVIRFKRRNKLYSKNWKTWKVLNAQNK